MKVRIRQDAIVRSLRRNGTSTLADLAEAVGASRRTVLRDISALRDHGFVIYSEPGRGGGLQLDPQSVQTTARLSVAEVFALLISVASMRALAVCPSQVWLMPVLPCLASRQAAGSAADLDPLVCRAAVSTGRYFGYEDDGHHAAAGFRGCISPTATIALSILRLEKNRDQPKC
ncbi:helix-turn-helix transcriptional regulator [Pseudochrobactrum kiredjianiae]|uniref:Helix-turn-helix transcriptional regulator n=1 Tax=Pseudochrobactrum kiredjianiae TaxID=386305 RepID=A0ABW3V0B3_9HYPH|nr:HTH domain-containing protein [Pseudochrobactrum kiredjianiae]MDM7852811.1 HTH domain-containing protein [Pseudochrobactrum kiredjianiae]